jgi:hypothetical protein
MREECQELRALLVDPLNVYATGESSKKPQIRRVPSKAEVKI